MNLKVKIEELGWKAGTLVVLYYKSGRWRIFEKDDIMVIRGKLSEKRRKNIIDDIAYWKHVKSSDVMIGSLPEFLTLEVDIQEQT